MTAPVLVMGATGTVGSRVAALLRALDVPLRAASRSPRGPDGVALDLLDASTWDAAFAGVRTAFVVRPPQVGDVRRQMLPALERARALGVEHMVLLSVQGAGAMPFLPHAVAERWLRSAGIGWTFLRPAYFHQNLSGVLAPDVRERDTLVVPCGDARMAFVDAMDVAAVAVHALLRPDAHAGRAWTVTGDEAPTWHEVAAVLGEVRDRPVRYRPLTARGFLRHARATLGMDPGEAVVTTAIHAAARLDRSARLTGDLRAVTGRAPVGLRQFAERERAAWAPTRG